MTERWAKPVRVYAVEEDPNHFALVGGRDVAMKEYDLTVSEEDKERLRLGYVCIACLEPHREAFPEKCKLCGYPMRANQPGRFEATFYGEKWVGPRISLEEELERLDELEARKKHRKGQMIWVPGSDAA